MESKKGYEFISPFDQKSMVTIYNGEPLELKNLLFASLLEYFTDKHSEYLEKAFEKYFNKVILYPRNKNVRNELEEIKPHLKNHFYSLIFMQLVHQAKAIRENQTEAIREKHTIDYLGIELDKIVHQLFFFAGVIFSVNEGKIKRLKNKVGRLNYENSSLYNTVKQLQNKDKRKPKNNHLNKIKDYLNIYPEDKALLNKGTELAYKISGWINKKDPQYKYTKGALRTTITENRIELKEYVNGILKY